MKKILLALIVQAYLLSITGCAGDGASGKGNLAQTNISPPLSAEETQAQAEFKIAVFKGFNALSVSSADKAKIINDYFDPALKYYEDKYGHSNAKIFCAHGRATPVTYALKGYTEKRETLVLDKTWADAAYAKGYALLELGIFSEVKQYLTKALELSPYNPTYHFEMGQILQREKKLARSAGFL